MRSSMGFGKEKWRESQEDVDPRQRVDTREKFLPSVCAQ